MEGSEAPSQSINYTLLPSHDPSDFHGIMVLMKPPPLASSKNMSDHEPTVRRHDQIVVCASRGFQPAMNFLATSAEEVTTSMGLTGAFIASFSRKSSIPTQLIDEREQTSSCRVLAGVEVLIYRGRVSTEHGTHGSLIRRYIVCDGYIYAKGPAFWLP